MENQQEKDKVVEKQSEDKPEQAQKAESDVNVQNKASEVLMPIEQSDEIKQDNAEKDR